MSIDLEEEKKKFQKLMQVKKLVKADPWLWEWLWDEIGSMESQISSDIGEKFTKFWEDKGIDND